MPVRLNDGEKELASGADAVWQALQPLIAKAADDRDRIRRIERDEIGTINGAIEAERLAVRAAELRAGREGPLRVAAARAAMEQRLADSTPAMPRPRRASAKCSLRPPPRA